MYLPTAEALLLGAVCYLNLIKLFLQSSYQAEIGQSLDFITALQGIVGRFTEKRYKSVVKV